MYSLKPTTLLAWVAIASAARITISIPGSQLLPNPSTLPSFTHGILLGPPGVRYDALIRRDNTILFEDIPDASYLLTVHSRDHFFPPLRVDVNKTDDSSQTISAWGTFRGNEWSNKGAPYGTAQDTIMIDVRPIGLKEFYQERGGFSLLAFFKNPMILMALVSVVMIVGLPYVMENMDPEAKAEFEEMSKKSPLMGSGGPAAQVQGFDMAGWLAGKQTSDSPTPAPASGASSKKK